eukprot:tig00001388_g8571.t1
MPPKRSSEAPEAAPSSSATAASSAAASTSTSAAARFAAVSGLPHTDGLPLKVEVVMKLRSAGADSEALIFDCRDEGAAHAGPPKGPHPSEIRVVFRGDEARQYARIARKDMLVLRSFALEDEEEGGRHPFRLAVHAAAPGGPEPPVTVLRGPHRGIVPLSELEAEPAAGGSDPKRPRPDPSSASGGAPAPVSTPAPAPAAAPRPALSFGPPQPAPSSSSSSSSSSSLSAPAGLQYTRLADVRLGTLHVWGVVLDYIVPYRTGGSDYNARLVVADESCPAGVQLTLFGPPGYLPLPGRLGEVFRGERIQFEMFNGRLCGKAFFRNIPAPAWSLFPGAPGGPVAPVSSDPKGRLTAEDTRRVEELRSFAVSLLSGNPLPRATFRKRLEDVLSVGVSEADILCQVLSDPVDVGPAMEVLVWDGAGARRRRRAGAVVAARLARACGAGPPLRALLASLRPGDWVLLKLASSSSSSSAGAGAPPAPRLELAAKSSVLRVPPPPATLPPQEALAAATAAAAAAASVAPPHRTPPRRPWPVRSRGLPSRRTAASSPSPAVPATSFDSVPLSSLAEVLASENVPWKFRCRARIEGLVPSKVGTPALLLLALC